MSFFSSFCVLSINLWSSLMQLCMRLPIQTIPLINWINRLCTLFSVLTEYPEIQWSLFWRFQFNHHFDTVAIVVCYYYYHWHSYFMSETEKQVFTVVEPKLKTEQNKKLKTLLKIQTNKPTTKKKNQRITKHKQRWFSTPLDRKYHFVYGFFFVYVQSIGSFQTRFKQLQLAKNKKNHDREREGTRERENTHTFAFQCKWIGIWCIAFAGGSMELALHGSQVDKDYSHSFIYYD